MSRIVITALTVVIFCFRLDEGTNIKLYFPPSESSRYPHLRLIGTLPPLEEFTSCAWINPHSFHVQGKYVLCYATSSDFDYVALALTATNTSGYQTNYVELHVGVSKLSFECTEITWTVGVWYHVCASWFGPNGNAKVYVNSQQCTGVKNSTIATGQNIPGGGIFIIGQEQDALGSGFNWNQSWHGYISDLHIWNEVLTYSQIKESGNCEGQRKSGSVFSWMVTPITALDGVEFSETQLRQV